jgi:hypothetical protein
VLSISTTLLGFHAETLKHLIVSCQFCTDTLSLLSKNFLLLTSVYLLPLELIVLIILLRLQKVEDKGVEPLTSRMQI